jgi:hypothetical protein
MTDQKVALAAAFEQIRRLKDEPPVAGDIATQLAIHMFDALWEIEQFGYANPGHGFTCARMASKALGKEPR